jgi:hypothetical protein
LAIGLLRPSLPEPGLGGVHDMIDIYPIILMFVVMLVWVFTARQNGKLVQAFWERLPKVAAQELPGTLDRRPENFIFFFRRRAAEVLRGDEVLWKMRQRLVLWVVLSVLTPILAMLPLLIFAVMSFR